MGRYALDSYRLFCCRLVGEDDWKNLMPHDKELRVYVVSPIVFFARQLVYLGAEVAMGYFG